MGAEDIEEDDESFNEKMKRLTAKLEEDKLSPRKSSEISQLPKQILFSLAKREKAKQKSLQKV